MKTPTLLTRVALLDEILEPYASTLGGDFEGYRNHTHRVVNFASALSSREPSGEPETLKKLAITAAFHDLGIWTDKTFDYLPPSERLALAYLARTSQEPLQREIEAMIHEHHKITRHPSGGLIEIFRQADWIDVSKGLLTFGLPRRFVREVLSTFPNAGFHRRLVQLSFSRLLRHPLNPLPMFRL